MPLEPKLIRDSSGESSEQDSVGEGARAQAAPLWLQRISLFILVVFCVYLGVIVAVLPWWMSLWDHNALLQAHPRVWAVLRLGFVRGLISGFGLLDVWIGISEAVHYRDQRS